MVNKKDLENETKNYMEDRQKRKLGSLLKSPKESVKLEKIDLNADPFKTINNRYKTICDTYRHSEKTEKTIGSPNETLTDIYSPS